MEFKLTPQGYLIYATMLGYLLVYVAAVARRRRLAEGLFIVSFLVAAAAYIYRWVHVQHVPMQNLFEVFLTLGVLIYPISVLSRRLLGVQALGSDAVLGLIVLVPAGLVFHAEPQRLPPALQSWLFAPHVAVYMFSYLFMAKAAFQASFQLWHADNAPRSREYEYSSYQMVRVGFPLLTLGLLLGSWWGKLAWGDYWGWDPKELWSLVSWLAFVLYLHYRYMFGRRHARTNSALVIAGMAAIVITLLWVNLSRLFSGLHSYA